MLPAFDPTYRALTLLICVCLSLACRPPQAKLGDGPPNGDANMLLLAVFDPAALAAPEASGLDLANAVAGPPQAPKPAPLPAPKVVDYGPTAEASDYPTIQIRFNRPMVPLGEKTRISAKQAGFEISPVIEGEAYWAEPTRLVFEPTTELPIATTYAVKFQRRVQTVDGPPLDVDLAWSFGTEPPRVSMSASYADQMGRGYHWKAGVAVYASPGISARELRELLSVTARDLQGDTQGVNVKLRELPRDRHGYRSPDFEITPATRWPAAAEIVVQLAPGLTSKLGPRPIEDPYTYSFDTVAGVESTRLNCSEGEYADGCEIGPVSLYFTAPITRAQAKLITISPKPDGLDVLAVGRTWAQGKRSPNAYEGVMLWGDFKRGVAYEVEIDPRLHDIHGQRLIGTLSHDLNFVEPPVSLALAQAWGSFTSPSAAKIGIESRHVEQLRVRVAVLDDADYERLRERDLHQSGWPSDISPTHEERIALQHTGKWGWSSRELDLSKYTGGSSGALLVEVGVDSLLPRARGRNLPSAQRSLVQITELGVSAVGSLSQGVVRIARLSDDKPIVGAEVELINGPGGTREVIGKTDAKGLFELPGSAELHRNALLRARTSNDAVLLDVRQLWTAAAPQGPLRHGERVQATLMTERPLYKPGERVRAMGWAAIATPYELAGLRQLPAKTRVRIELRDAHDELVATKIVSAKTHGKFWATLDIPETAALGNYSVTAKLYGSTHTARLQVKDYPVPEFEVTASASRTDLHSGEATTIRVDASYYFGGRVPILRSRALTECSEVDFRPPGIDPSWSVNPQRDYHMGIGGFGRPWPTPATGPAAQAGHMEYDLVPVSHTLARTQRCKHSVAVGDLTQREVGAETTLWVHPEFYLAANAPSVVERGQDANIEIATVDFDGSPLPVDDVQVTLTRSWTEPEYVKEHGKQRFAGWRDRTKKLAPCRTKSRGVAACSFPKLEHGSYEIAVSAKHGEYAPTINTWLWVHDPRQSAWAQVPVQELSVSVNKPKPKPGDVIRARVQAPWLTGQGLLMLAKGSLHELRSFELSNGSAELEFTVDDAWIPGAKLQVIAIEPGTSATTPSFRSANIEVEVASDSRRLSVRVEAPSVAHTRDRVPITITVRDATGQPTRGHVSVWAVDEAVLSLAPLELPDFVAQFVVRLGARLSFANSYAALMLPYVAQIDAYSPRQFYRDWASDGGDGLVGSGTGYGGGGGGSGSGIGIGGIGGPGMPATRSEFSSAPIFIGDAELDESGVAKLEGELPDNLTTFRLTAVASAKAPSGPVEARFGTGDARIRVTRPLVVRAALPRILRPGDLAEVGVLVDNLGGGDGTVELEVELHDAKGVLELLSKPRASASISAGQQIRIPFTVRAQSTGEPQFEVRATLKPNQPSLPIGDALRLPLPVEPERTMTDRVAVYGSLADDGAALLPFAIPVDADPKFGGLSVSVGSTLLGGLEDAVAYLVKYPYGCLEQTSSSLLPLIPLGQLAKVYPLGIGDVDSYVEAGITRLQAMQLSNGGFSYWPGGSRAAPYASAYATWVLIRADAAGYRIPAAMLDGAVGYLLRLVDTWSQRAGPSMGEDIEVAQMLAALAERGHAPAQALTLLYARRRRLPVFSQAMLLLALEANYAHTQIEDPRVAELMRELESLVDEREAVAKIETNGTRWTWYWDSDARSSAIVLMALLRADPMHPLASKLTRGLLESRHGGRWSNTQENAYAIMALADYAAIYEADEPDFDGRVWLGNSVLTSVHVEGRAFGFQDGFTPMNALLDVNLDAATAATAGQASGEDRLILERAGQGRMYYRVGLEWASTATDKPAKAEGIRITRSLRGEAGLVGDDQAVSSGDLLAIDVEIEVPAALDYVAIEVPLPAGVEAIDLELGKGSAAMKLSGHRGAWVSHQELRRDRAVLFADHIAPGQYRTTVFLRATTPGDYVMPAGHAEMMYYPEVYGRTTARRLLVR